MSARPIQRGVAIPSVRSSNTIVVTDDGKRKKPSLSSPRRKLKLYRDGGFEALSRKPRGDRGKPRTRREDIVERAVDNRVAERVSERTL